MLSVAFFRYLLLTIKLNNVDPTPPTTGVLDNTTSLKPLEFASQFAPNFTREIS